MTLLDVVLNSNISAVTWLSVIPATLVVYLFGLAIYNRYFHPLKDIPGPFWASITPLWYYRAIITSDYKSYQSAIHEKYGPMVRLAPDHVQFSDPGAIDTIYGPKYAFEKSKFYDPFDAGLAPMPDNFCIRDEKIHNQRRKAVAHIYTQAAVLEYEPSVEKIIQQFEDRLEVFLKSPTTPFDISVWFRKYTLDVISDIFFGHDGGIGYIRDNKDYNNWGVLLDVMVKPVSAVAYAPYGLQTILRASQILFTETRTALLGFFNIMKQSTAVIQDRLDDMAAGRPVSTKDALSKLLGVVQTKDQKFKFGLPDVTAEVFAIIFAGADTTATSITSIFYFLHKYPETLAKLRAEIDLAFDEGRLTMPVRFGDANKLPYLRAVVAEAGRLHPSVGLSLPRVTPVGGAEISGKHFPGGCEVAINPAVVQLDTKIFGEDALEWVPERWIRDGEKAAARMDRHILQFGYGKRICIGKNVANIEMFKLIATILYNYEFELTGNKTWTTKREWFQQQKDVFVTVRRREPVKAN